MTASPERIIEQSVLAPVQAFAESYRVKVRRDGCSHEIIPGKKFCKDMPDRVEYRSHVYEGFGGGKLGLCLLYTTKRRWNNARRKLLAAGFVITQVGDTEGCATFDSENDGQSRLALRLAGVKRRRVLSEAQRAVLVRARQRSGFGQTPLQTTVRALGTSNDSGKAKLVNPWDSSVSRNSSGGGELPARFAARV